MAAMLIGYARVSTVDQDPALQRDALKRAGCERIFEETASGAKSDRPQLAKVRELLRKGDTLIVWKLDRLARSMQQLIETVAALEADGVQFQSLTEKIDTGTAGGRFVFHIFGALAEFERSLIRERTHAGLQAARARGRKGGRPKSMLADDLRVAETLLDSGLGATDVARRLDVSRSTLFRRLREAKEAAEKVKSFGPLDTDEAFAASIKQLVKGRSTKPFHDKISIGEAHRIGLIMGLDLGTIEQFKKRLADIAREGLIELERCDIADALPKEVLQHSRLRMGRDERHLIVSKGS